MDIVAVEYRLYSKRNAVTVQKGVYFIVSPRHARRKRSINVKPLRVSGREPL